MFLIGVHMQSRANIKINIWELLEHLDVLVYATKNRIGEGGMLLTDSKKLYDRARILSLHGMDRAAWNDMGKVATGIMMFLK